MANSSTQQIATETPIYTMKMSKSLPSHDIRTIETHTRNCFNHPTYLHGERYFCLSKNGTLVASLCFMDDRYIVNVCTAKEERKKGHQRKLFDYTLNWIYEKSNLGLKYVI